MCSIMCLNLLIRHKFCVVGWYVIAGWENFYNYSIAFNKYQHMFHVLLFQFTELLSKSWNLTKLRVYFLIDIEIFELN